MKPEDEKKLSELNKAVDDALSARTKWLDEKMEEYAGIKVGEDIYDLRTGMRLGTVSKLYRYWAGQNPLFDTALNINYEYRERRFVFGNTSCQPGLEFGTKADASKRFKEIAEGLSGSLRSDTKGEIAGCAGEAPAGRK